MKFFLVFLILIYFVPTAQAEENTPLKIVGNLLLLVDWHQTRQIANHPEIYYEKNKFLGKHPSVKKVDSYFIAAIIGINLLDYVIKDEKISNAFWIGIITVEGYTVSRNLGIGLRLNF